MKMYAYQNYLWAAMSQVWLRLQAVIVIVHITRDVCSASEQQFHQQSENNQSVERTGHHDVGHCINVTTWWWQAPLLEAGSTITFNCLEELFHKLPIVYCKPNPNCCVSLVHSNFCSVKVAKTDSTVVWKFSAHWKIEFCFWGCCYSH